MFLYLGNDFTTTANGAVVKFVQCDQCGHEYAYELSRSVQGRAFSVVGLHNREAADRSSSKAQNRLQELLKRACDLVPCPQCGWYQEPMVARAKRRRLRWMRELGRGVGFFGLSILFWGPLVYFGFDRMTPGIKLLLGFGTACGAAIISAALLGIRHAIISGFTPNDEPLDQRIALARSRAVSKEEYLKSAGSHSGFAF
jgi:hypothetical protein